MQRCGCGFVGNRWAVAGHRGRHLSARCSAPPTPVDAHQIEALLRAWRDDGNLDIDDLDQMSEVTRLLLAFSCHLRTGDLVALSLDDVESRDAVAVLLRVQRTQRAVRVVCTCRLPPDFLCLKCTLEHYLRLRIVQGPPGPGALFLSTPSWRGRPHGDAWS